MSLLLHLSDLHFGTEVEPALEALVELAHEQQPQVIVVSGDITQRARRAQFDRARRFIDRLPAPGRIVIPGNHDIPLFNLFARWQAPFAGWQRVFGADMEPTLASEHFWVAGVNTTRAARHKDGEVSAAQVARVAAGLQAAPIDALRIVVTHHPVAVITAHDQQNLLHGAGPAIRAWAQAGADLLLGGHIHLPYTLALHDTVRELNRRMWVLQAGTATSSRIRDEAPQSVNLVRRLGAGRWSVERWDLGVNGRFSPLESHVIEPDRGSSGSCRMCPTSTPSDRPTPQAGTNGHTLAGVPYAASPWPASCARESS